MKLIGNNGEVLAEWIPNGKKRNLYCAGGFGLMLTKRALARCIRADDTETIYMFKVPDQVEDVAIPELEEKKEDSSFWGLIYG